MKNAVVEGCKKLFKKRDQLDRQIIDLVKNGRLNIYITDFNEPKKNLKLKYSRKKLPSKGRHTS